MQPHIAELRRKHLFIGKLSRTIGNHHRNAIAVQEFITLAGEVGRVPRLQHMPGLEWNPSVERGLGDSLVMLRNR
ncbi:MAG: hypothetical protein ABI613_10995 [Gemmatimonadota bacterium]